METYTFVEDDGRGEVCIVSTDLAEVVEVVISPVKKDIENPAIGVTLLWHTLTLQLLISISHYVMIIHR